MLDYKDIITKHYALGMSGMAIAKSLNASPSGVNDFLRAFKECKTLDYPLPQGITNYGIAEAVYGKSPAISGRDLSYEMPDYEAVAKEMSSRKNMTLVVLWNRYSKHCRDCGLKFLICFKSLMGKVHDDRGLLQHSFFDFHPSFRKKPYACVLQV